MDWWTAVHHRRVKRLSYIFSSFFPFTFEMSFYTCWHVHVVYLRKVMKNNSLLHNPLHFNDICIFSELVCRADSLQWVIGELVFCSLSRDLRGQGYIFNLWRRISVYFTEFLRKLFSAHFACPLGNTSYRLSYVPLSAVCYTVPLTYIWAILCVGLSPGETLAVWDRERLQFAESIITSGCVEW